MIINGISIHAPHARSDRQHQLLAGGKAISIHAPHARSDYQYLSGAQGHHISIHAPHARSDAISVRLLPSSTSFQSTLLMRGATSPSMLRGSTHSNFNPRSSCEERRCDAGRRAAKAQNFNPRSSCEERHYTKIMLRMSISYFNPRSSCEERPLFLSTICLHIRFQSTLLMRGATICAEARLELDAYFNPRSSCEERRISARCGAS